MMQTQRKVKMTPVYHYANDDANKCTCSRVIPVFCFSCEQRLTQEMEDWEKVALEDHLG